MKFAEKLKKAMQELNLNQRQVVTMTGKSKGSVSQYLSGKQIPSEDVQSAIATSLGLASDYFTGMDKELQVMPQLEIRDGVIPRLDVTKAAKLMGMNHNTVRKGLQQGVFPWGYAVHTSDNRWSYFINAKRFHKKLSLPQSGNQYEKGKQDLFVVVIAFRYLLPGKDFLEFKRKLIKEIDRVNREVEHISEVELLNKMGFPENWKNITRYHLK